VSPPAPVERHQSNSPQSSSLAHNTNGV
jgi:hypothetical protein